ncbi:MAG: LytR/AlgR family response regulator transcription factor [Saprospiraceae bacterium]
MTFTYRDRTTQILGSLFIAYFVDAIGRRTSIFEQLQHYYFYVDVLVGSIGVFILWEILRQVIRFLDRRYSWEQQPIPRLVLQVLLGVLLPSLLGFGYALLQKKLIWQENIFATDWLNTELPVVMLLLFIINLYYYIYYLHLKNQALASVSLSPPPAPEEATAKWETLIVNKGRKNIPLPLEQIAYLYLEHGYVYVKTFANEAFLLSYPLDTLERNLPTNTFFRVNRQILIHRRACEAFQNAEYGKINVTLTPPHKAPVVVSQKRAKDFRAWIMS